LIVRVVLVLTMVACAAPARRESPPQARPLDARTSDAPLASHDARDAPDAGVDSAMATATEPPAVRPLPEDPAEWPMLAAMGDARALEALQKLPEDQRPCEGTGSMRCDLQANVIAGAKPGIFGTVSKHFVSGVPGNDGSDMELPPCNVVAVDSRSGKKYPAPLTKKGTYAVYVPAGTYRVIFDDCFKCVVMYHPKLPTLTLTKADSAAANARCSVLGK
jgi:hypothetical protein